MNQNTVLDEYQNPVVLHDNEDFEKMRKAALKDGIKIKIVS